MSIDWATIRGAYVSGDISQRKLAESRGVTYAQLRRVAEREGWASLKTKRHQRAKEKEPLRTEYELRIFQRLSRAQGRIFYNLNGEPRRLVLTGVAYFGKWPTVSHFAEAILVLRFPRTQINRLHPSKSELRRMGTGALRQLCEVEHSPLYGTRGMLLKRLQAAEIRRLCDLPESVRPLVGAKEIVTK